MSRWTAVFAGSTLVLVPAVSQGNDTIFRANAAAAYPLESTDIRLESERVTFKEVSRNKFDVTAILNFYNASDEPVRAQLGFPDTGTSGWREDVDLRPGIENLRVQVNGEAVSSMGVLGRETHARSEWVAVHTFDATFPPKSPTSIRHVYRVEASSASVGVYWVQYVFSTGANWAGNIREAVFVFELASPRTGLRWAERARAGSHARPIAEPRGVEFRFEGGPRPRVVATYRDVKPREDVYLEWGEGAAYARTLATSAAWGRAREYDVVRLPYIDKPCEMEFLSFLRSAWRIETTSLTDRLLCCWQPSLLRNGLYASVGYPFKKQRYVDTFYNNGLFHRSATPFDESWLTPTVSKLVDELEQRELGTAASGSPSRAACEAVGGK